MIRRKDIGETLNAGEMQLYDHYMPALPGGNFFISLEQTIGGSGATKDMGPVQTMQEFVVVAPQYRIDTSQVVSKYPPAGSSGSFGEVLPNIVLKDPLLPWERFIDDGGAPWLALLVFEDDELTPGGDKDDLAFTTTVDQFNNQQAPILKSNAQKEIDVEGASSCRYINMPVAVFQAVVPYENELSFLSHVRRIDTGDRPILGLDENGLFAIITANRFPAANRGVGAKTIKNIVHLVSLEGMSDYLHPNASFSSYTTVSLITLASWTFQTLPESGASFYGLAKNLVDQETNAQNQVDPARLWLRLPIPENVPAGYGQEVLNRLSDGYVPLAYCTRSGENTYAWYRGPLAPLLPPPYKPVDQFYTADEAMIYDKEYGIFDNSLAVAWETGRELALSDFDFLQKVNFFRKNIAEHADQLYYRADSPLFNSDPKDGIATLDLTTRAQDILLDLLKDHLAANIGKAASKPIPAKAAVGSIAVAAEKKRFEGMARQSSYASMKAFAKKSAVQERIRSLAQEQADPLADWLAKLTLLYPVPFEKIVPDERLLPVESIRFFYVDKNWIGAAMDGALSLSLDSSKQQFYQESVHSVIKEAALRKVKGLRKRMLGRPVEDDGTPPAVISGFLLRSALVSGWPNMAVRAKDQDDNSLIIIRIDRLSENVLFCLFNGVPNNVTFSEPQESLSFGVDESGNAVLRSISDSTAGVQIGQPVQIRDLNEQNKLCMRAADSRVLNIDPTDNSGLIKVLEAALAKQNQAPPGGLNAATLAIQLIKSAEAVVFNSQNS